MHRAGACRNIVTECGVERPETTVMRNGLSEAVRGDQVGRCKAARIHRCEVRLKRLMPQIKQAIVREHDIALVALQPHAARHRSVRNFRETRFIIGSCQALLMDHAARQRVKSE